MRTGNSLLKFIKFGSEFLDEALLEWLLLFLTDISESEPRFGSFEFGLTPLSEVYS